MARNSNPSMIGMFMSDKITLSRGLMPALSLLSASSPE